MSRPQGRGAPAVPRLVQASGHGTALGSIYIGQAYLHARTLGRRSGQQEYLAQVRDIAPRGGLVGRDAEIALMAQFCSGPDMYWWWQADAWAGKSALMSEFVLSPPPGVVLVSFFVTARYAGQDDSTAFTGSVLAQLGDAVGLDTISEAASAADMASAFRLALRRASRQLHDRSQRLVLVIDGCLSSTAWMRTGAPVAACPASHQCFPGTRNQG
jgi:hypothetical protein